MMSDFPEFCEVEHRIAKKEHKCSECHGKIEPRDVHERTAGKWDGSFSVFKVCMHCETARDWLLNNTEWKEAFFLDDGVEFFFGELREHLREYGREGDRTKAFRAYRHVVSMDRRRRSAKAKA